MSIFHRYNSTIHGNYRRAYLRSGLITGVLLAAGNMALNSQHLSLVADYSTLLLDILLIVAVILFTAYYRNSLPDHKITLKEAMLFGIGTAAVAALLYALLLLVLQTTIYNPQPLDSDYPRRYWAVWNAILALLQTLLLGSFAAFIAAIFLRNEKSEIHHKK